MHVMMRVEVCLHIAFVPSGKILEIMWLIMLVGHTERGKKML